MLSHLLTACARVRACVRVCVCARASRIKIGNDVGPNNLNEFIECV